MKLFAHKLSKSQLISEDFFLVFKYSRLWNRRTPWNKRSPTLLKNFTSECKCIFTSIKALRSFFKKKILIFSQKSLNVAQCLFRSLE